MLEGFGCMRGGTLWLCRGRLGFMYGLNRLRKNIDFGVLSVESLPRGLKPTLIPFR